MGLDVVSLNSGHSNRVHDSGSTTSSKRVRDRKQRASKPSMRGVSISTKSLASKESKRRRRRRPKKIEDHHQRDADDNEDEDDEDQQEVSSFDKRWDRISNFEDPLDSGKTEHTSNLTEHSRTIRQGLGDDDSIYNKAEDESNSSDNEEVVSLGGSERSGGQTVETRESRFQGLLNQWKTREKEQKEITQATAPDTRSKANYLSEDEDHSCFEGVLKHWRKRDGRATSVESYQQEVVVDDETSEVSSLGDSLRDGMRWGYESDSRFDFSFDARFDTAIPVSPRSAKKKKKKSSKKKEECRSPKLSKKKKNRDSKSKGEKIKSSDVSYATFDAAMDAAEAVMDGSVATMDTTDSKKKKKKRSKSKKYGAAMDAAEAAMDESIATMDESVATMDTTDSKKKKKKKSRSKSKKKVKSKKSSKKSLVGNENSESTETEVPPLSDDEGSKGAYLPGWLSPAQLSPKKRKSKVDSPKKNDPPPAEIPELPNLL